jgi:hypothetical protein
MADPLPCTSLLGVRSKSGDDSRPHFVPAIGTGHRSKRNERIDVRTRPMYTAALGSCFDHNFVGTSVLPLPIGYPAAWNVAYCTCARRLVKYVSVRSRALAAAVGSTAWWIGNLATAVRICRSSSAACLSVWACSSNHACKHRRRLAEDRFGRRRSSAPANVENPQSVRRLVGARPPALAPIRLHPAPRRQLWRSPCHGGRSPRMRGA